MNCKIVRIAKEVKRRDVAMFTFILIEWFSWNCDQIKRSNSLIPFCPLAIFFHHLASLSTGSTIHRRPQVS